MTHLLLPELREVLAQLAWSRMLLGFDFDGTLAPIVEDREAARMREKTLGLFRRVCRLYPVAVISGRRREDVTPRLEGAEVKYVIGNHGIETGENLAQLEAEVMVARARLEHAVRGLPGVEIEDKRYSLSLHYRRSRNKRLARATIERTAEAMPTPLRVAMGKQVIHLAPRSALNKGDALLMIREVERADTALYVGDDMSDEAVFSLDQPGRLCSVRVGESRSSAAAYFLRNQGEIDRLLSTLADLRERTPRDGEAR